MIYTQATIRSALLLSKVLYRYRGNATDYKGEQGIGVKMSTSWKGFEIRQTFGRILIEGEQVEKNVDVHDDLEVPRSSE